MGLRIKSNTSSLRVQRSLETNVAEVNSSMAKLSEGSRITKAADDAAGLSISENLRADIRGLNQARRNTLDGISIVQVAEGGVQEIANMLIRLRELAVQASSDTIGREERTFLDKEIIECKEEIDRIAISTQFNDSHVLIAEAEGLQSDMDDMLQRAPLEIQVGKDYYNDADSLDNPNPVNIIRLDFTSMNLTTEGFNSLRLGRGPDGVHVHTKRRAQASLEAVDEAIVRLNDYRAYLGSIQARLQSTMTNLAVQVENLAESQSRIRDTDYAAETAKLASKKILTQGSIAMLSTANVQTKIALQLLG